MSGLSIDPNNVGAQADATSTPEAGRRFSSRLDGPVKPVGYATRRTYPACECGARHPYAAWSSGKQGIYKDLTEYRMLHYSGVLRSKDVYDKDGRRIVWTDFHENQLTELEHELASCPKCGRAAATPHEEITEAITIVDPAIRRGMFLMSVGRWLHKLFPERK
jgi:hypothetical protein